MQRQYTIVLGGGESGVWSALLAEREGHRVLLSDSGTLRAEHRALLSEHQITLEEGGHVLPDLEEATTVVKSPGIPDSAPIVRRCADVGIAVVSEIEFAARYASGALMVAITGSNGKTTTTTLTTALLRAAEMDAVACGNIGVSLAQCVVRDPHEVYVMELSSFQLDHMYQTHAHAAVLLNITPDHLDRYDHQLSLYADAKGRVLQNLTSGDYAILNADDAETDAMLLRRGECSAQSLTFSTRRADTDAYFDGEQIHIRLEDGSEVCYDYGSMPLRGSHNAANIMAACLVVRSLGGESALRDGRILSALQQFGGIEHRMEPAGTWRGVAFVNDSKATNIDATQYALGAMPNDKTVVILGGTDKGNDYSILLPLIRRTAKALIYMTRDNAKLHAAFDALQIPSYDTYSLSETFEVIRQLPLEEGDMVLLSPACASFDLFRNYEERGQLFKEAVARLISQEV